MSSNTAAKFKVTLEFEVDIDEIVLPDVDTYMRKQIYGSNQKPNKRAMTSAELRAALKKKGLSDDDVETHLKEYGKRGAGGKAKAAGQDFQLLLYPEYEQWVAAQQSLRCEILQDDALSAEYVREMVRDLTRGKIETLLNDRYGSFDLNQVLAEAIQRLPTADQTTLKAEEEGLLHDETELVDDAVSCRFNGLEVIRIREPVSTE